MATLTSSDFTAIKHIIKRDPSAKAVLWGLGLTKSTWYALFQETEDWFVGGFGSTPTSSLKAAMETHAGTLTNVQAKEIAWVWMGWRYGGHV